MSEESQVNTFPTVGHENLQQLPESGLSIFLEERCKKIHFIRHAEGIHNAATSAAGSNEPITHSTPGSEKYQDACLTEEGKAQCKTLHNEIQKKTKAGEMNIGLVVVSPFVRTLETAQISIGDFDSAETPPFIIHELCRERTGLYTCDKMKTKSVVKESFPTDGIEWDRFNPHEEDEFWTTTREDAEDIKARAVQFLQWLAARPEKEIAVVTHSSFLRHLFMQFGWNEAQSDRERIQRKVSNCEMRTVTLCSHRPWVDHTSCRDLVESEIYTDKEGNKKKRLKFTC
eukprot:m.2681 g.2681  ORF g.2681 m.2681 type:complete len:286 (-) comp2570_c0_seq1:191-1048(-)